MAFLSATFAILTIIFLIATILGVFSPALFKNKKTRETPKRLHIFLGGVFLSAIALIITALLVVVY